MVYIYLGDEKNCLWYITKSKQWKVVRGLDSLDMNPPGRVIEMAN